MPDYRPFSPDWWAEFRRNWSWRTDPLCIILIGFLWHPAFGLFLSLTYLVGVGIVAIGKVVNSFFAAVDRSFAAAHQRVHSFKRRLVSFWEDLHYWPPPLPRPPTTEERVAVAKQQYERTLALLATAKLDEVELKAAQDHAKQLYLRAINEVMK